MPPETEPPPDVVSAGYLLFRASPQTGSLQFLLMQHSDRWDLPKGHVDAGETIEQAALRELREETGIATDHVWTDPNFRFDYRYEIQRRGQIRRKLLVIFLGWLHRDRPLELTEHIGFHWFDWSPPHIIQTRSIDPLLAAVETYLARKPDWPDSAADV